MTVLTVLCILGIAGGALSKLESSNLETEITRNNTCCHDLEIRKTSQSETDSELGLIIGTQTNTNQLIMETVNEKCGTENKTYVQLLNNDRDTAQKVHSLYIRYQSYVEITAKIGEYTLHAALYIGSVLAEFFCLLTMLARDMWDIVSFCFCSVRNLVFGLRSSWTMSNLISFDHLNALNNVDVPHGLLELKADFSQCLKSYVLKSSNIFKHAANSIEQLILMLIDITDLLTTLGQDIGTGILAFINVLEASMSPVFHQCLIWCHSFCQGIKHFLSQLRSSAEQAFTSISSCVYLLLEAAYNLCVECVYSGFCDLIQGSILPMLQYPYFAWSWPRAPPSPRAELAGPPRPESPRGAHSRPRRASLAPRAAAVMQLIVPGFLTPQHHQTHSPDTHTYTSTSHSGGLGVHWAVYPGDWFPVSVVVLLTLCLLVGVLIAGTLLLVLSELRSRPHTLSTHKFAYKNQFKIGPKVDKNQCIVNDTNQSEQTSLAVPSLSEPAHYDLTRSKLGSLFPQPWLTDATVMVVQHDTQNSPADEVPHVEVSSVTETEDDDTDHTDQSETESITRSHLKPDSSLPWSDSSRENTPDKKISRRFRNASWNSDNSNSDLEPGLDVKDTSQASSQGDSKRRPKVVWVTEDGEIHLDRGKTCKLSYISKYITEDGAANITRELSDAINNLCNPSNKDRFRIDLAHGGASKLTDVDPKKATRKVKKSTKPSELSVNLDETSELSSLITKYCVSLSSAMSGIFQFEAEFDKCTIHRMKNSSHNLPYESATTDDGGAFSPTVAILALGAEETRPMFIRTKAGSQVTHKVALKSGSLCVLSGSSETRYKRSIPREYGTDGDQYYLIFRQKTPATCMLEELKIIETSQSKSSEDRSEQKVVHKDVKTNLLVSDGVKDSVKADAGTAPSPSEGLNLKTPPTVRRVTSAAGDEMQFHDQIDYETSENLLLTATISAAVEKMDEETVTTELLRNQMPVAGSLDQKRKRLQQKMCLTVGELSMAASNNSMIHGMSYSRVDSPVNSKENNATMDQMKENLESVNNAQKCIEKTLKHIVESIVNIKSDVTQVQEAVSRPSIRHAEPKEQVTSNDKVLDELSRLSRSMVDCNKKIEDLSKCKDLSRTMKDCSGKVDDLLQNVLQSKDALQSIRKDLSNLQDNATEVMRKSVEDMGSYYNSVFADESRVQIEEIHKYVTSEICDAWVQTDLPLGMKPEKAQHPDAQSQAGSNQQQKVPSPSAPFTFPDRICPSLKVKVASKKRIDVLLITDSIMRHINEDALRFRKYNICFDRVDRTCSKSLTEKKLEEIIARKKPTIIYLHLGINDIHKGSNAPQIIENFKKFDSLLIRVSPATRLIISAPLLNGKSEQYGQVFSLRQSLSQIVRNQAGGEDPAERRLYIQHNDQFFNTSESTRVQNPRYFREDDLVHLSERGRTAIACTMRNSLETVLKLHEPTL